MSDAGFTTHDNSPPGQYDQTAFARQVLAALGAPQSNANVQFLLTWFKREGTRAAYNPMATTLKYGSYTNFNKVGVKNYADEATGVGATVRTLTSGYKGIVADLVKGDTVAAATNHPDEFKKWSGGGYDHLDVVGSTAGGTVTNAATTGGASGGTLLPANATAAQTEQYIRTNYPQASGFLDIPEIRAILIDEAKKAGDAQEVQARIQATSWWKTHAASTRQYLAMQSTDPAEAEAMLRRKMTELAPEVASLGLDIDLRVYADEALKYGWTPEQVKADESIRLRMQSSATGLKPGSAIAVSADHLAAMARSEYFVPLNRQDTEKWAIDINEGRQSEDTYRAYLTRLSAGRFPGTSDQGITPGQYMAPIRNVIADTLELQPGDVDLLSAKYSEVLQTQQKDGTFRPMTISEAQKWARGQKEYVYTKGAMDNAASFGEMLAQKFGAVSA